MASICNKRYFQFKKSLENKGIFIFVQGLYGLNANSYGKKG